MHIEYTIRTYQNSKEIKILVHKNGVVTVTKPWWVKTSVVEKFVQEKAEWIKISQRKQVLRVKSILEKDDPKEYYRYKDKAKRFIYKKIIELNQNYNFTYRKISIRNQVSRWGSCSSEKNLSFNYKILFLPIYLAEYITVHELCHLKELNHSQKFWDLVAETIPDYKQRICDLKKM